jgi:hypothetical protein
MNELTLPEIVRPRQVTLATGIFVFSLLLMLLDGVHNWLESASTNGLLAWTFTYLFFSLVTWRIYKGKKWARNTYAVISILAVVACGVGFGKNAEIYAIFRHQSIASWLWLFFTSLLDIYAFVLLFTRPGNQWFD